MLLVAFSAAGSIADAPGVAEFCSAVALGVEN